MPDMTAHRPAARHWAAWRAVHRARCAWPELLCHRPAVPGPAVALSGAGPAEADDAAFRAAGRAGRQPARRSRHDRRQASARAAAARPLRARRGLDRLSPVLPRDGEDRLRGVRHARDDPSRRRAGPRRARPSAGEVRHHLSLRAGRVRPDVPGLGLRHLELRHQALRLGGAEEAAARPAAEPGPGDDAQGHAVHDREGRRLGRRRAGNRGRAHRCRPRRRRALEALWPEMVLQSRRCRCRRPAGQAARRSARHAGARHVRHAAAAGGRLPQQLSDRAAEGQARHAFDGLGRDHHGRRGRLPGGRCRPRLQADDGAGEPLPPEPRRARGRDDAPLPQRGDGGGAKPPRLRPCDRRIPAAAPPTDEDHAADRAGAVHVRLLGRRHGPRQRGRRGGGQPAAHPDAGLQVPRLPRQHPGRQPRPRGEGRPGLHRGMGHRPPGARRADRHLVGGHLQHQRARRGAARRRQDGRPQDADGGAEGQVRTLRRAARPVQGPARRHARSRRALRRGGRRGPCAGEALSPGRRRALSRHDGGAAGLGGRRAGRQGRRRAPPACCRGW